MFAGCVCFIWKDNFDGELNGNVDGRRIEW